MSPFMSSMPAAGLIEMPPVSKQTPLPTKATRLGLASCAALGAAPAHDRRRGSRDREPWPTPSSAPMPSSLHRRLIEDLDLDAELFELLRAARRIPPDRAHWPAR